MTSWIFVIICSGSGLSPVQWQPTTWTNDDLLLITGQIKVSPSQSETFNLTLKWRIPLAGLQARISPELDSQEYSAMKKHI